MNRYTAIQWLVHWPMTGGLLHLVQQGRAWAGYDKQDSLMRGSLFGKWTSSRPRYCCKLLHNWPSCWSHSTSHWSDSHLARYSSRFAMCLPHLQSTPSLGGSPVEHRHDVWYGKLEWCGYPTVKKFWTLCYSFRQITRTWWMDRNTNGWTLYDSIGCVYAYQCEAKIQYINHETL